MLALLLFPQGAIATGLDVGRIIEELLPSLNAYSTGDLVGLKEDDLRRYADDAAQRLARLCGVLVERAEIAMPGGAATATLPDRHLSTVHAAFNRRALRPTSVQELEALDSAWLTASGDVERISHDYEGTKTARLYRVPDEPGMLALVYHSRPDAVSAEHLTLDAPEPAGDYLSFSMLAEARQREGDGHMPEVAAESRRRADMLSEVIRSYWGGGAQ